MNKRNAQMVMDTLAAFRELKHDITASQVITFLTIATRDGVTSEEIERLLGVSQAAASRNLRVFDYKEPGLGLADTMMSRTDSKTKMRVPSPDGAEFIKLLEEVVGE